MSLLQLVWVLFCNGGIIYPSIYLSIYLYTVPIYLPTYLPTYPVYPSIYLPTHLSIFLSMLPTGSALTHTHTLQRREYTCIHILYTVYIYHIYVLCIYIHILCVYIYIYQQNRASKNTMQFIRQIMRGKETREEKTSSFEVGALQFMLRFPTNLVRPRLQPVLLWRAVRP